MKLIKALTTCSCIRRMAFLCLVSPLFVATAFAQQIGYTQPASESNGRVEMVSAGGNTKANFIAAMDRLGASGGTVLFQTGTHNVTSDLFLRSDIHVRFQAGVRITTDKNRVKIFNIGAEGGAVRNVSIVGNQATNNNNWSPQLIAPPRDLIGGDEPHWMAVQIRDVANFKIQSLLAYEKFSDWNVINIGGPARSGTIAGIRVLGVSGPGWGAIQLKGGNGLRIKNILSVGGATLRMEQSNLDAGGGWRNIRASGIVNRRGRAAVMLAPSPQMYNDNIRIWGVRSFGSQWAVQQFSKNGGTASDVLVRNVRASYGADAQFRRAAGRELIADFLPESLRGLTEFDLPLFNRPEKFQSGPSFGVLAKNADWLEVRGIRDGTGFPSAFNGQPAVITPDVRARLIAERNN